MPRGAPLGDLGDRRFGALDTKSTMTSGAPGAPAATDPPGKTTAELPAS